MRYHSLTLSLVHLYWRGRPLCGAEKASKDQGDDYRVLSCSECLRTIRGESKK